MSARVHPVFDRVRSDFTTALDSGRVAAPQAVAWMSSLARGEHPEMDREVADAVRRMTWLLFVRATQLDPMYVALAPMYLGFMSSGQKTLGEMVDELAALEAKHPDADQAVLDTLLTTHGDALGTLVMAAVGQGGAAGDRIDAVSRKMAQRARALAEAGRWDEVPFSGPDAAAVRLSMKALPADKALQVYDLWMRAERAASKERWAEAVQSMNEAANISAHLFETFVRRARYRFAAGERIPAGADLERALSLNQRSAVAHAMRAELRVLIKDMVGSLEDWDAAVAAAPEEVGYRIGRAYTRVAMGKIELALEDFCTAVEMAPEDTTPLYNRADAYVRKGDLPSALADYDRILELTPEDVAARMNRGTVRLMQRDGEAAWVDFDEIVRSRPMHATASAKRAQAELLRGRPWAAWLDAATALSVGGPDWEHREAIVRMLQMAHQQLDGTEHAKVSAVDVAHRMDALRTKATGTEVLQMADLLGANLPAEMLELHLLRGRAYLDYGKWALAAESYGDALAVQERHAGAWLGRGRALLHAQQVEDACTALGRARSLAFDLDETETFELYLAWGRAAGSQQRLQDAIEAFDAALGIRPDRADVWFYKGVHLDLAGDRTGALEAYSQSVERDDAFAPAWFNRACENAILGHQDAALSDLRRAASLEPKWAGEAAKDAYFRSMWADPRLQAIVAEHAG